MKWSTGDEIVNICSKFRHGTRVIVTGTDAVQFLYRLYMSWIHGIEIAQTFPVYHMYR